MRRRGFQRNLWRGSTTQETVAKADPIPKRDSWQPKILAVKRHRQNCWLIDSATDVHVGNNLRLMTDFTKRSNRVGGSTADGVSPGHGTVRIRLALEEGSKRLILNLRNNFYYPNSPSNLVSLGLLNDASVYYDNERHALYDKISRKPRAFTQRLETSFILHPLKLSVSATNLLKAECNIYQDAEPKVHQTQSDKLPLTIWHKRFGHLNFPALRKNLTQHKICYSNDDRVCNGCERGKATKHYNRTLQESAKRPYQLIHTDLVGPITPIRFGAERYFFMFTDDHTRIFETYTGKRKSE